MAKNIVICCDGTGNQLGETYSNVVRFYSVLEKIPGEQVVYYDAGVGTLSYSNIVIPLWRRVKKGFALALGLGLEQNVSEAYSFLMDNFEGGDRIYLFGFSRGAYTVRVLAGLIKEMGFLEKNCQHLIPYAWDSYRLCFKPKIGAVAHQFKAYFSRDVNIHFMGLWDTVSSIGLLFGYKTYPHTQKNDRVQIVRHAMAIDERRRFYRQNLFVQNATHQDVKQVWFAGVHSDVGGSYALNQSGLAQISLSWMIREARPAKLLFSDSMIAHVIPEKDQPNNSAANPNGMIHPSLAGFWWLFELWPKKDRETKRRRPPLGAPRKMFIGPTGEAITPTIHSSVQERINSPSTNYAPKNLLQSKKYYAKED